MIEYQFATVPAGERHGHGAKGRKHQAIGQHVMVAVDADAGIGRGDRQEHHGGNGVVPAGDANTNAGNGQEFERTGNGSQEAEDEGRASRPETDLDPERIGRPPVKNVDAQGGDDKGYGEMHQHGVDRVTGHGDGGADVFFRHVANKGIGVVGACFDAVFRAALVGRGVFFGSDLLFLLVARFFRHHLVPLLKALLLVGTPVVLAGCSGELSTLDPAGPRAANLATLWWIMLAGSVALFALVMVLFALAYFRSGWISRITPMQWIVGGGLVLPIPILVLLTGTALVLGEQLLPKGEAPVRIEGQAQRWSWSFSYPGGAAIAGDTLHMPAGEPVDIVVTSMDVIHSFWVPRLGGKIDAIPGHTNVVRLEADEPGIYWGQCAEYCGEGHDGMRFRVEAHDAESFAALMAGEQQ
jgi:cytochrome c oxidase subunit II